MGVTHVRALILAAVVALPVAAHEIGTTQVHALFRRDHTYRIDVVTAPRGLLTKIEAAEGLPRTAGDAPMRTVDARLQALAPPVLRHVDVSFGTPNVAIFANDYAATIRLTGEIPREARTFTWHYGLTYSTYALTLQNEGDPTPARQWLDGDTTSTPFPLSAAVIPPTRWQVARQYLVLGYTHIVPHGFDHILFVVGLCLLTRKMKQILSQVTAFTIAHSITLALTLYGVVSLSPRIVEPMIALSIAYIAIENLAVSEMKPWRVAIVFAFGLLHGMGFAGVLRDLGLPRREFLTALVSFNGGVEIGQLSVIAAAFVLFAPRWRDRVMRPASAAIALTGLFWTVQRLFT